MKNAEAALKIRQVQVLQDAETRRKSALIVWSVGYLKFFLPYGQFYTRTKITVTFFQLIKIGILTHMEVATKRVSSESKPTACFILPIIGRLYAADMETVFNNLKADMFKSGKAGNLECGFE